MFVLYAVRWCISREGVHLCNFRWDRGHRYISDYTGTHLRRWLIENQHATSCFVKPIGGSTSGKSDAAKSLHAVRNAVAVGEQWGQRMPYLLLCSNVVPTYGRMPYALSLWLRCMTSFWMRYGDVILRTPLQGFWLIPFSSLYLLPTRITVETLWPVMVEISWRECSSSRMSIMRSRLNSVSCLYHPQRFEGGKLTTCSTFIANRVWHTDFNTCVHTFIYTCYVKILRALFGSNMGDCFLTLIFCIFYHALNFL